MTTFLLLLLAHLIADFYLQSHSWIIDKVKYKEKSLGLFKHILVHLVLSLLVLLGTQELNANILIALLIIVLSHYLIDIWKTYMGFTTKFFVLDQLAHILVIVAVSLWLSGIDAQAIMVFIIEKFSSNYIIVLMAYLFAYKPLSILIQLLMRPYLIQFDSNKNENHGLEKAGEYIGGLERFLIITFVILEQYAGIGFLLAAKSVFRFGDMRRQQDRKLTEYIMLGSLLSFTFALLLGLLVRQYL